MLRRPFAAPATIGPVVSAAIVLAAYLLRMGAAYGQEPASIRGVVVDSTHGAPVPGANVDLLDHPSGAATGRDGRFVVEGLTPGRYVVACTFVGYRPARLRLTLAPGEEAEIRLVLAERELTAREIVVSGEAIGPAHSANLEVLAPDMGSLRALPGLFQDDLSRGLRRLPGVSTSSDLSTDLHVRGGSPGHTLVRLDGATLFNTGHSLGLFSAFNPDAIRSVSLYKGAYPARYGGRLGSVLQLRTKRNEAGGFHGSLQAGALSSRLSLSGPHPAGSWTLSARGSTIEPMFDELRRRNVEGLPRRFSFYDLTGAARIEYAQGHRTDLSVFAARDHVELPVNRKLLFDASYENWAATLAGSHLLGESVLAEWSAAASRYASRAYVRRTRVPFARRVGVREGAAQTRITYSRGARFEASLGGRLARRRYRVRDVHMEDARLDRTLRRTRAAAFLDAAYRPASWGELRLGVRGAYTRSGERLRISPRAVLEVRPFDRVRLQVGAGRYHQFVTLSGTPTLSAFDVWLPAGSGVPPARGDEASAAAEVDLPAGIGLKIEGYYRRMDELFRLDTRLPDATGMPYEDLFLRGEGRAYGAELLLRRPEGRLGGLLAYTWARTLRRFSSINDGRYFAPGFDRRHQVDAVLKFRIARGWRLTGAYRYATARPYTRPAGYFTLVDAPYQGHHHATFLAPRNNARLPPYRRLDLGVEKRGRLFGAGRYRLKLQVINVLGRRNVWFHAFQVDRAYAVRRYTMPQIPVPIPNLSVRVSF